MILNFIFIYVDKFMQEYAKQTGEAAQPLDEWDGAVVRYIGKCYADGMAVETCVKNVIDGSYR